MKHLSLPFLLFASAAASAQGIVIPDEPDVPPLALERHAVRVEIDNQAAVTTVEQIYRNNTDRRLEAKYVFPIPKGAALSRFTMLINGKETAGEMVEKDKAHRIYQAIVHRSQDPGLLEYLGGEIFRASIFPIEPKSRQTITIRFAQALAAENGLVGYLYPVRAGTKRGPTVHGESAIDVLIRSAVPIQNVYSPSHPVTVERKDDREVRVTWSQAGSTWHRDFQLFYGHGEQGVAADLLACRPDPTEPGYFMLLLSPRLRLEPDQIVARDIVFVVDTSGSMSGEKIEQARRALRHCVENLNDGDRFNIVRFSSDVYPWKDELVPAKTMREAAKAWIDRFQAAGSTDIMGALREALRYPKDPSRPYVIVFMTDGKPTLGETTDSKEILARLAKARTGEVRIFTWGVGYDVDTQLLDGIANSSRGVSEYVRPEEDIAVKVSSFWGKAGKPVLADLRIDVVEGPRLRQVQPIPDLYAGGQVILFGRYEDHGKAKLRLTGQVNGRTETFEYEAEFPATLARNGFVETLWARRRIGYLLDAIRIHGESKEVVDEVVALSKKYGIQTPYTSWLILEDGTAVPTSRNEERGRWDEKKDRKLAQYGSGGAGDESARREHNADSEDFSDGFTKKEGKSSVRTSEFVRKMKEAERQDSSRTAPFQRAAGVRYFLYRGLWVDERFDADAAITAVKFGSEAYFRILEKRPELLAAFKLGSAIVIMTARGKALVITEKGEDKLGDERIEALFR